MGIDVLSTLDAVVQMRIIALIVVLCCAVVDDMRRFRISNRIIMAGVIMSCMSAIVGCVMYGSLHTIIDNLTGGVIGFAAAFAIYAVRGIGAGDVKLFMVCGMLVGYRYVCEMLIISLVAGVIIGAVEMIARSGKVVDIRGIKVHATHFSLGILVGNVCVIVKMLCM